MGVLAFLASPLGRLAMGAVAVFAAGLILLGLKHGYDDRRRDEGRAEIQAKWDADKAQRLHAYTAMTTQWTSAQLDAEKTATDLATERQGRINDAKKRIRALPPADAAVRFPASARRVLNDAIGDDAGAAGAAAEPAGHSAEATADSRVDLVTQWATDVIDHYNECRDEVIGLQRFYAALRAAQPKETAP